MSKSVTDRRVATLGYRRLSVDARQVRVKSEAEEVEVTCLEDRQTQYAKGPGKYSFEIPGYVSKTAESVYLEQLADSDALIPLLVSLQNGTPHGARVRMARGQLFRRSEENTYGDLAGMQLDGHLSDGLIIGRVLHQPLYSPGVTASAAGTAFQLGEVAADEKLIACQVILHPPGVSGVGPQLDTVIESDAANTFGGGEVQRLALQSATDDRSTWFEWTEVPGPITDTWWRPRFTVAGTDPVFYPFVVAAIVPA